MFFYLFFAFWQGKTVIASTITTTTAIVRIVIICWCYLLVLLTIVIISMFAMYVYIYFGEAGTASPKSHNFTITIISFVTRIQNDCTLSSHVLLDRLSGELRVAQEKCPRSVPKTRKGTSLRVSEVEGCPKSKPIQVIPLSSKP